MPQPPPCPWCGVTLPAMMMQQFEMGHDPLPCPRCGKDVPLVMARALASGGA